MSVLIGGVIAAAAASLGATLTFLTARKESKIKQTGDIFQHMSAELERQAKRSAELEQTNVALHREMVELRSWAISLVHVLQNNDIQVDLPPSIFGE